jgi:hypothetical protein
MLRKIQTLSLFVVLFAFAACKKDKEEETREKLLTSGRWQVSAMTIDPGIPFGGVTITDYYNSTLYPACVKDDFVTFNANGTLVVDEGATKCDLSAPQTVSGTWTFNSDKTIITTTIEGESSSVTILELTKSSMKGRYSEEIDGVQYNLTITYRKI